MISSPTDRLLSDQGNLFQLLGPAAGDRYLEYEIRLSTDDPEQMPELTWADFYLICLDE